MSTVAESNGCSVAETHVAKNGGNETGTLQCKTGCGFADAEVRAADSKERSASAKKLCLAVILCLVFMSFEVAGGIKADSLAVLTDAAHLLSDVAGFAISLFAIWASGWEATPRQTYGFFRLEILGALVSIQLIWLITGILVYEAIDRMIHSSGDVDGMLMFIVATFGLIVNLLMVFVLGHAHGHGHDHSHGHGHDHSHGHGHGHDNGHGHGHDHGHESHGHKDNQKHIFKVEHHDHHHEHNHEEEHPKADGISSEVAVKEPLLPNSHVRICVDEDVEDGLRKDKSRKNINVEGAYLHVLGDLIQSIGVMIGGAIIWVKPEWKIVDLICTLFFSVLVLATTIRMLRNILEVLMESTPREIDATKLEEGLLAINGVVAVHELHIWAITVGKILLACHVRIESSADADAILQKVIDYCEKDYNISHVTVQIERESW